MQEWTDDTAKSVDFVKFSLLRAKAGTPYSSSKGKKKLFLKYFHVTQQPGSFVPLQRRSIYYKEGMVSQHLHDRKRKFPSLNGIF
jgi:hypothetical protein